MYILCVAENASVVNHRGLMLEMIFSDDTKKKKRVTDEVDEDGLLVAVVVQKKGHFFKLGELFVSVVPFCQLAFHRRLAT